MKESSTASIPIRRASCLVGNAQYDVRRLDKFEVVTNGISLQEQFNFQVGGGGEK
jgi:hypothetical protein